MNFLLVSPLLIPLTTAACCLLVWRQRHIQRVLSLLGTALLLAAGLVLLDIVRKEGIQVTQIGNWPWPVGISLVMDLFSAIMIVLAGLMGLAVVLYSFASIDEGREAHGYYPFFNLLLMGVCGAFLTGDLFNLYVWFEVMLMASFVLLALGGERAQLEGAIKYVSLNLLSSAFFLTGVGITYGLAGTLNMADLAVKLSGPTSQPMLVTTVAMLFLASFSIKAAVFPFFFWLPASYHTPPVAVSAIFAGLLTKVGVYALIRLFTLLFTQDLGYTHLVILVLSGFTMVTGVLGAAAQNEFRRILSFHIVSQIGYMIMGLGLAGLLLASPDTRDLAIFALAGSIFYIIHHIIVKTNLFLISGVARKLGGSFELKTLGGLYRHYPWLGFLFLIPALSLAGMPPLSGFFAKLALVQAALRAEHYAIVAVALVVGMLTLFSMTKIWLEAFWKPRPAEMDGLVSGETPGRELGRSRLVLLVFPIASLALLTVIIGLGAESFFELSYQAAEQLIDPTDYKRIVSGGKL